MNNVSVPLCYFATLDYNIQFRLNVNFSTEDVTLVTHHLFLKHLASRCISLGMPVLTASVLAVRRPRVLSMALSPASQFPWQVMSG